jgi:hypothetical protein
MHAYTSLPSSLSLSRFVSTHSILCAVPHTHSCTCVPSTSNTLNGREKLGSTLPFYYHLPFATAYDRERHRLTLFSAKCAIISLLPSSTSARSLFSLSRCVRHSTRFNPPTNSSRQATNRLFHSFHTPPEREENTEFFLRHCFYASLQAASGSGSSSMW